METSGNVLVPKWSKITTKELAALKKFLGHEVHIQRPENSAKRLVFVTGTLGLQLVRRFFLVFEMHMFGKHPMFPLGINSNLFSRYLDACDKQDQLL